MTVRKLLIKSITGYHGKEINKGIPLIECGELPLDGLRKIHSLSGALCLCPEAIVFCIFMK